MTISVPFLQLMIQIPSFQNLLKEHISSLSNILISPSEVSDILSNLKLNKASGPDGISHRMLKNTSGSIATPLCKLFNLSLKTNSFPSLWKLAHVMAIFKKEDKSRASNYIPISLISCVGKTFERIIFKHVYNHLISNSLINISLTFYQDTLQYIT